MLRLLAEAGSLFRFWSGSGIWPYSIECCIRPIDMPPGRERPILGERLTEEEMCMSLEVLVASGRLEPTLLMASLDLES